MPVDELIRHIVLECTNPGCMMRFPVLLQASVTGGCPLCGSPVRRASAPYEERHVRSGTNDAGCPGTEALLDNIRSLYNVGSMFRTADGAGISRMHLCGTTPTPLNPRLKKTALGAEESVPWALSATASLQRRGSRVRA
jgi:hypothetical protein